MSDLVNQAIKDVLQKEFSIAPETVTPELVLRDIPGIESLRILRMVVRLEKALGIELPDERIFDVVTAGDLAHVLESEMANPTAEAQA